MYSSAEEVLKKHSREEEGSEEKRKIKRPRAKLTCLNCKRRKTKCDKSYPCSSCVSRGEGSSCQYEEGYEPTQAESSSGHSEFKAISERLERIEVALTSRPTSNPGTPSFQYPQQRSLKNNTGRKLERAATQELAHSVLVASRIKGNNTSSPHTFRSPSIELSNIRSPVDDKDSWPSIVLNHQYPRSPKWTRDMHAIVNSLPSQSQVDFMIDFYFSQMQLLGLHVVEDVFKKELSQFWSLRSLSLHLSVDPAWLAQLICILWVTCHYLSESEEMLRSESVVKMGLTRSSIIDLGLHLFDSLELSFSCANWLFKPQLRILHTLLVAIYLNMQGCYLTGPLYGPPKDFSCCLWFDIAVGICKALELHLDPSPVDIVKLEDPALPPDRPVYCQQMIRRAFYDLLIFDTYTMINSTDVSRTLFPYAFPDDSVLTPPPLNYTNEALLSESTSCSRSEKTPFVWAMHQSIISQEWRKIVILLENLDDIPYSAVTERSQILRDAFTDFLAIKAESELNQYELDAFALTYSSYHQRFLRLHRPFFLRGYHNKQFEHSKTTVVTAARQIAKTHRRLLSDSSDHSIVRSAVFMFQHHITALPILLLNALHDTSSSSQMRQELVTSSECFMKSFSAGVQAHTRIAAKGVCIANEMVKVIDNPPTSLDDIEEILQNVNIQAKAHESEMMEKSIINRVTTWQPAIQATTRFHPVTAPTETIGSDLNLFQNADQNWWDLE
ncbi:uncharacterized protein L201_004246 [Kwoniella dendrophila CBS 6074]|uniref:Zn(2)-C6 fungal-type domain-containing protein n=1 Tax=Kwoniella dendrophila CBS 6074 TaxID=1295534 RepID=A0AAX4JXS4_9TREE